MVQKLYFLASNTVTYLQTEENKALKYTVNARQVTAINALQGEIGASSTDFQVYEVKYFLQQAHTAARRPTERNIVTSI